MIRMSRDSGSSASARTSRARAGERERDDSLERALEQRAARDFQQPGVEALVEFEVALERLVVVAVHELLIASLSSRSVRRSRRAGAALGGEARGGAFEHASQLDRIADIGPGELAHDVAAAGQSAQQALVLERGERQPQRRARDAEPLDQRQLGHPRAGSEFAAEDQLAQRAAARG